MSDLFDLRETDKLLSTTRAVRKRLDLARPVEESVLLDCVRLSQQAPTGSNTQLWRWMMVTDQEKRAAVAAVYARGAGIISQLRDELPEDASQTRRVYDSAGYLFDHLHKVPVLAIPCVIGRPENPADHCVMASTFGSILPAVWSFQLALRSRGLGSAWTTLHLMWEQEVADILGIPDDVMQVALLPVAYTSGTEFKPAARPPPEEITHWNNWPGD
jgi:nitroreductase